MIKINGVAIATPKIYEATVSDLDGESNRNAAGQLIRDRIAVKRKLNLEWGPLSQSEIAPILNAVSGVFFTVTFPDPQLGIITKTMYVGDRTAPAYQYIDEEVKWSGLKLNLIEK
ncbi:MULTISPECIES: DUF6711 family protein [Clostridium]|jgi:hypothetical protein|uniref:DUF6711 family protein n=1 Tax=Clostridium TaxID=1485 RepID=UPI000404A1FD|nr:MULTISPECIES: DUF6711 family protein [Clostridium]DAE80073.1 MAG TPA: hypothetical protein [Caudoviricetes sp.]MDB2123732.1 hypothetical protein [Clostridium paraputrificum]MDC0801523.1 hypothetical protein [Clostridium paraputrificum]MDU5211670.1 DUF6711 family protein [Clostridium sp.]CUN79549.1 Lj965 prophage protein [Clostridium paraputrificum]